MRLFHWLELNWEAATGDGEARDGYWSHSGWPLHSSASRHQRAPFIPSLVFPVCRPTPPLIFPPPPPPFRCPSPSQPLVSYRRRMDAMKLGPVANPRSVSGWTPRLANNKRVSGRAHALPIYHSIQLFSLVLICSDAPNPWQGELAARTKRLFCVLHAYICEKKKIKHGFLCFFLELAFGWCTDVYINDVLKLVLPDGENPAFSFFCI